MKKPNDDNVKKILKWHLEGDDGLYHIIRDWRSSINEGLFDDDDDIEEAVVQRLYQDHQDYYNTDNDCANDFLTTEGNFTYDICLTIEKLYRYWQEEIGDDVYFDKETILGKLDLIYYFEAEYILQHLIENEDMDLSYWG